jgi:hypothetical protein
VAFLGLARVDDELIAAGTDGIYRMQCDGSVTKEPTQSSRTWMGSK